MYKLQNCVFFSGRPNWPEKVIARKKFISLIELSYLLLYLLTYLLTYLYALTYFLIRYKCICMKK